MLANVPLATAEKQPTAKTSSQEKLQRAQTALDVFRSGEQNAR
jgi:hypothetical protein